MTKGSKTVAAVNKNHPALPAGRGSVSSSIAALSIPESTAMPTVRPIAAHVLDAVGPSRSGSVPTERMRGSSSRSNLRYNFAFTF